LINKYYRLTKPGIIRGNLLTVIGGFLLASKGVVDGWLLLQTVVGSTLVMASGCVFNNYLDQEIDAKMKRTQKRALVSGEISKRSALVFGVVLGVLGIATLIVFTNPVTVLVGMVGWFAYVVVYSIFKRRTRFGTLVGSVSGAIPPAGGRGDWRTS
jgi:protoheme IX farnesyltransferase